MEKGRSSGFAQNAKELNKSSGVGASIVKDSLMFKEIAEQHDSNDVPRKSSNTIRIEGGAANEVSEDKGKNDAFEARGTSPVPDTMHPLQGCGRRDHHAAAEGDARTRRHFHHTNRLL